MLGPRSKNLKVAERYSTRFRTVEDDRWKRYNGPAAERLDRPTVIEEMIDMTESTLQRLRKRECA